MNRKLGLRLAFGLLALAALILIYQWFREFGQDVDLPAKADTAGQIAAVQILEDGARVVLIQPDGTVRPSPDYRQGATDKDPVWQPDGNRLFFCSDREVGSFNLFRWNPASDKVSRRTVGSTSKSSPSFGLAIPDAEHRLLLMAGGFVNEVNPRDASSRQILPPTAAAQSADPEGGAAGQFDSIYRRLGESFKSARWGKGGKLIIAVMARENGEVLVVQGLEPTPRSGSASLGLPPPIAVVAADRIDYDVAADGRVVAAVLGYQFVDPSQIPPERLENGVAKPPYRHALVVFDPANVTAQGLSPLMVSDKDAFAIAEPCFSPDGAAIVALAGSYGEHSQFQTREMVVMPAQERGIQLAAPVAKGRIREPSWSPSGDRLVFVRADETGRRSICTIGRDGTDEVNVTGGRGDFASPRYSPQRRG
jgi:hypothetical protein